MLSKTAGSDAVALILDGESHTNDEISLELEEVFNESDIPVWDSVQADVYTYAGRTLILAYPTPPLLSRISDSSIRLVRK